jgi:O-antigen ligase
MINAVTIILLIGTTSRGSAAFYIVAILLTYLVVGPRASRAWILQASWHAVFICVSVLGAAFWLTTQTGWDFVEEVPLISKLTQISGDERQLYAQYVYSILQHPEIFLFGTGFDSFYPALKAYGIDLSQHSQYGLVDYDTYSSGAHNLFLIALSEGGLFFFSVVVALLIVTPAIAWRNIRSSIDQETYAIYAFIFIQMISLIVPMLLFDVWFRPSSARSYPQQRPPGAHAKG